MCESEARSRAQVRDPSPQVTWTDHGKNAGGEIEHFLQVGCEWNSRKRFHLLLLYPRMFSAIRPFHRTTWDLSRNLHRLSRNTTSFGAKGSALLSSSRRLSTKPPSPSSGPKTMPTYAHTHFEEGNSSYVAGFEDKGKLAIPPAKHLAIGALLCTVYRSCLRRT